MQDIAGYNIQNISEAIVPGKCNPDDKKTQKDLSRMWLDIDGKNVISPDVSQKIIQEKGVLGVYQEVIEDKEIALHFALNNHQDGLMASAHLVSAFLLVTLEEKMDKSDTDQEVVEVMNFMQHVSAAIQNYKIRIESPKNGEKAYRYTISVVHPTTKEGIYSIDLDVRHEDGFIIYQNPKISLGDSAKKIGLSEEVLNQDIAGRTQKYPLAEANKIDFEGFKYTLKQNLSKIKEESAQQAEIEPRVQSDVVSAPRVVVRKVNKTLRVDRHRKLIIPAKKQVQSTVVSSQTQPHAEPIAPATIVAEVKSESAVVQVPTIKINFSPSAVKSFIDGQNEPELVDLILEQYVEYADVNSENSKRIFKKPLTFTPVFLHELGRGPTYHFGDQSFGSYTQDGQKIRGLVINLEDNGSIDVATSSANIVKAFNAAGITDDEQIVRSLSAMTQNSAVFGYDLFLVSLDDIPTIENLSKNIKIPTLIKYNGEFYLYGQLETGKAARITKLGKIEALEKLNFGNTSKIYVSPVRNKEIFEEIQSKKGHYLFDSSIDVKTNNLSLSTIVDINKDVRSGISTGREAKITLTVKDGTVHLNVVSQGFIGLGTSIADQEAIVSNQYQIKKIEDNPVEISVGEHFLEFPANVPGNIIADLGKLVRQDGGVEFINCSSEDKKAALERYMQGMLVDAKKSKRMTEKWVAFRQVSKVIQNDEYKLYAAANLDVVELNSLKAAYIAQAEAECKKCVVNIAQKILKGNILTEADKEIVAQIIAPYSDRELMSAEPAIQILSVYNFSRLSKNWSTEILQALGESDRQNIAQNNLLFAAFQVEIATGQTDGPIAKKIVADALNEPNIIGTIFESETHQANKVARDILRSTPLHLIDKLMTQQDPMLHEAKKMAEIVLGIPQEELTKKFQDFKPSSEKFKAGVTALKYDDKSAEPSWWDNIMDAVGRFFGTSASRVHENANILMGETKWQPVNTASFLTSQAVAQPTSSLPVSRVPKSIIPSPVVMKKAVTQKPQEAAHFSIWDVFDSSRKFNISFLSKLFRSVFPNIPPKPMNSDTKATAALMTSAPDEATKKENEEFSDIFSDVTRVADELERDMSVKTPVGPNGKEMPEVSLPNRQQHGFGITS